MGYEIIDDIKETLQVGDKIYNIEDLTPTIYFDYVKGMKKDIADENLQVVADNCLTLLQKTKITGQTKAAKKIVDQYSLIMRELKAASFGFNTIVYKSDIEKFEPYRKKLISSAIFGNADFAFVAYDVFMQRRKEYYLFAEEMLKKELSEKYGGIERIELQWKSETMYYGDYTASDVKIEKIFVYLNMEMTNSAYKEMIEYLFNQYGCEGQVINLEKVVG